MARPKKENEVFAYKVIVPKTLWEKWWDQFLEHDSKLDKDLAFLLGGGAEPIYSDKMKK